MLTSRFEAFHDLAEYPARSTDAPVGIAVELPALARIAQIIVAEVGLDVSRFKTASNLASWAGVCPGNRQSAGKSQGGETRKGNGWPRQALAEAAWAASRGTGTSLSATDHRLAGRRGGKRACLAVGHRIPRMVRDLLSSHRPYEEGGPEYYRPTDTDLLKDKLVQRLKKLGFAVTVAAVETAA